MARSRYTPAAEVDFSSREQAEGWFRRQSYNVCVALAVRSALRVVPLFDEEVPIVSDFEINYLPVLRLLRVFRACFVARSIAVYPSQRDRLQRATHAAAYAFDSSGPSAAASAAAAYAAMNATHLANDAANATAATDVAAGGVHSTPAAAARAAPAAAAATAAVRAEAVAIEQGVAVAEIVAAPLWPGEIPERIAAAWDRLRTWMLTADAANSWYPWVQWYERVRDGRPSFGETFDLAVASLTDEQWNEEPRPAAVNRRIAALLAEHTKPEPIPPQGPGPHFTLSPEYRIALAVEGEIDAEGNNLGRLRQQLPLVREAADDLAARLNRNECPELARNLTAYRASIDGEPETIAWGVVFSRGVRLDNAAAATRRQISDRLQPPLEDAAQEALDSLLSLHGPMILATTEGRELMADADRMNLTREQQAALRRDALAVATALNEDSEIIEKPAAEIVIEAVETIGEAPHPERGSAIGGATIRNVTILTVGIGAVAAIAGVGLLQAAAVVVAIEGLKKSKRFSALTDVLGARIDGVLRTGTAFQNFVVRNEQPLRQMAVNSAGMRWMLPYIDEIVGRNTGKNSSN
jgi:hypothetical protein